MDLNGRARKKRGEGKRRLDQEEQADGLQGRLRFEKDFARSWDGDSSLRASNIVQHADLANHGEKNLRKGAVVARQKSTWTSGIQGARIVQAARWRG